MDFQISTANLIRFLERCRCGKMVKDLIIQATSDMIYARFTDAHKLVYGEVYEKAVSIKEQGNIKVTSIEKLVNCLKRSECQTVRLKSTSNVFVVFDGAKSGNMKVKFTEAADEDFVESFAKIKQLNIKFDKDKLDYLSSKVLYKDGYKIPIESLQGICKDAKAFGMELFNFKVDAAGVLNCEIEDKSTNDSFTRLVPTTEKIGEAFKPCSVGTGLKEIATAIEDGFINEKKDDPRRNVLVYFDTTSLLLTDGSSYFYNFHTI